jgi:glycosyltransferase involved in cell wall biosynthesis
VHNVAAGRPTVSVVLCVRDAAATVGDQLRALATQACADPWELVVVDNGSRDATVAVVESWRPSLPGLRVVSAVDRAGLAYARNVGARVARGQLLAFCDGDDVVRPGWLSALVATCPPGGMAGGALAYDRLNDPVARYWRGDAPAADGLPLGHCFLPYAVGANYVIDRATYWEMGGCDERFLTASDDVDLSWRVQLAGRPVTYAPAAVVDYRLRDSVRAAARQRFAYGRAEALLYAKHRRHVDRQLEQWLRVLWFLSSRAHHLVRGRRLRGRWLCVAAYHAGRMLGSWERRVWFP